MACPPELSKYMGRDAIVEYALQKPASDDDWLRLGVMRGKEWGVEWQTSDATTDDSPNYTQENIVTFKQSTISFDGTSTKDDEKNVDKLEDYVNDPSIGGTECMIPYVYLRITVPRNDNKLKQYSGTAMLTSFRNSAPHDDVATWTLEGDTFVYDIEYIDATEAANP